MSETVVKDYRLALDFEGVRYIHQTPEELAAAGVPVALVLDGVKALLKAEVDDEAERLRALVTTPGVGQAMEYQEAQAQAFTALAKPDGATPDLYPMLAASIGVDIDPSTKAPATDVLGVARSVMAAYHAWAVLGAEIRGTRLKGKAEIEAAPTVEAAQAVRDAIAWPAIA